MKKRVCVADDDSSVRNSLKKILESSGYEVIVAADGSQAEERLDDPKIDLLILDLNMPNRDGWDVLENVTSNHPLMPVIIITAMSDQLATFTIPGSAALLQKPIEVPKILSKIEDLLSEPPEARLRRICDGQAPQPSWTLRPDNPLQSADKPSLKRPGRLPSSAGSKGA